MRYWFIDGGFAEMCENRLVVLTERALAPHEISAGDEEAALQQARAVRTTDLDGLAKRRRDIERASAKLKLAARAGG
jgi:F0F1-type ATP synthase epsilon subunit